VAAHDAGMVARVQGIGLHEREASASSGIAWRPTPLRTGAADKVPAAMTAEGGGAS
jgi:hypothetical protein